MQDTHLMTEMIEKCRRVILDQDEHALEHQPSDDWPAVKLNRWIGFIQCALIANRSLDLEEAKQMFNRAKKTSGESAQDLLDHLDPYSPFEFELGGEG
jgi:hypothetical protein